MNPLHLPLPLKLLASVNLLLLVPLLVRADCPLLTSRSPSYAQEIKGADWVVLGRLANAQLNRQGSDMGTTDLVISKVIKSHEALKGKDKIVLPRYMKPMGKEFYLVFGEARDGKLEIYRGEVFDSGEEELAEYLLESARLADAKPAQRLAYHFRYLDHKILGMDAHKIFAQESFTDTKAAAASYDRDKILRWVNDESLPDMQRDFAGLLLGMCGKPEDATLLRKHLDAWPDDKQAVRGFLIGYWLLKPKAGQDYLLNTINDEKLRFTKRSAAFLALKFQLNEIPANQRLSLLEKTQPCLMQHDLGDLVVELYRQNQAWSLTPAVLALYEKPDRITALTRRCIVRFALTSSEPAAKAFIAGLRKKDAKLVDDVEETLEFEKAKPKP